MILQLSRLVSRRATVLAWGAAIVSMAALLAGGALVAAAAHGNPAPHTVLGVTFTTRSFTGHAQGSRSAYELWTDPMLSRARLRFLPGRESLYYLRDDSGAWYAIGRAGSASPWRRSRLPAAQQPSLLAEDGVRRLFAALRRRAGTVTPTALHDHMAVAFTTTAVTWPYRYSGPMTVWLDDTTGLPLQFRAIMTGGTAATTVITVVDHLRTISSSSLPAGFFTPPDQRPTLWDAAVQRVATWLGSVGRGQ